VVGVFPSKSKIVEASRGADIEKFHAKIGQLVVELDFLVNAFGR